MGGSSRYYSPLQSLSNTAAVEHYRILWTFIRIVHETEADGRSICNAETCPIMSAGPYVHQKAVRY